jgi:hypothetical protein
MRGPPKRSGPTRHDEAARGTTAGTAAILPDRADARRRVEAETRRLRVARLAEQAMPLRRYYGPRPLLNLPIEALPRWWRPV